MLSSSEGLRSEELRNALSAALGGKDDQLFWLLARFGALPSPRPNVRLAAAFAAELRGEDIRGAELAMRMLDVVAEEETKEEFLYVAAGFAIVELLASPTIAKRTARDLEVALVKLLADMRRPARQGAVAACIAQAGRTGALAYIEHGNEWLELEEREDRFVVAAGITEIVSAPSSLATLRDDEALFALCTRYFNEIDVAPRAAERWLSRRLLVSALEAALPNMLIHLRGAPDWFAELCATTKHPDLRALLEKVLSSLHQGKLSSQTLARLFEALDASAPVRRDASRVRDGVRGRGKKKRKTS